MAFALVVHLGCIGIWARRVIPQFDSSQRCSGSRTHSGAIHTAFLSLSLPSALFLVTTLALYSGLGKAISGSLESDAVYAPTWVLTHIYKVPDVLHPGELFSSLITFSSTPAFLLFLYSLVLGVLLSVWGLFPLVWSDVRPPKNTSGRSRALGSWLDMGYRILSFAAICVFVAVPLTLTLGVMQRWTGVLGTGLFDSSRIGMHYGPQWAV